MKMDITKNEIYITKLVSVIQGYISRRVNPMYPEGRSRDGFIFILEGSCKYTFDDGIVFTAKEGDILYLAKNSRYRMDVECDKYEFIFFNFEFSDDTPKQSNTYKMKNPTEIKNIFFRLKNKFENKKGIVSCMTDVYRIYSYVCESTKASYISSKTRLRLLEAVNYIGTHYADENLTVPVVAEILNISEVYLRKIFKAEYGCSPLQYITSVRMENACKMLKSGLFTVEEAALQSGFKTPSYFSYVFKTAKGMTPVEYKQAKN